MSQTRDPVELFPASVGELKFQEVRELGNRLLTMIVKGREPDGSAELVLQGICRLADTEKIGDRITKVVQFFLVICSAPANLNPWVPFILEWMCRYNLTFRHWDAFYCRVLGAVKELPSLREGPAVQRLMNYYREDPFPSWRSLERRTPPRYRPIVGDPITLASLRWYRAAKELGIEHSFEELNPEIVCRRVQAHGWDATMTPSGYIRVHPDVMSAIIEELRNR
jgi:hypothetical protein